MVRGAVQDVRLAGPAGPAGALGAERSTSTPAPRTASSKGAGPQQWTRMPSGTSSSTAPRSRSPVSSCGAREPRSPHSGHCRSSPGRAGSGRERRRRRTPVRPPEVGALRDARASTPTPRPVLRGLLGPAVAGAVQPLDAVDLPAKSRETAQKSYTFTSDGGVGCSGCSPTSPDRTDLRKSLTCPCLVASFARSSLRPRASAAPGSHRSARIPGTSSPRLDNVVSPR